MQRHPIAVNSFVKMNGGLKKLLLDNVTSTNDKCKHVGKVSLPKDTKCQ